MNKKMPKGLMEARMLPDTFNEKERTVEVIWTTGMAVKRYDWWNDKFYMEELSMEPEHVRMERMDRGAPVLNSHSQRSLDDVIGVVQTARLEGNDGIATLKLSDTEADSNIIRKIQDGIIRNISVGYKIHKAEETKDENTNMSTFRVVDWEPLEVSFVPVPADFNSQVRGEDLEKIKSSMQSFDCEIITKGEEMTEAQKKAAEEARLRNETASNDKPDEVPTDEPPVDEAPTEEVPTDETPVDSDETVEGEEAERAATAERVRVLGLQELCAKHEISSDEQTRFISESISLKDAGAEILKQIEKRNETKKTNSKVEVTGMDNKKLRQEAMVRGLLNVADPKNKIAKGEEEFRAPSLLGAARMYLEREMGVKNVSSMTPKEISQRALHHTSDFPLIVEDLANKSLLEGYTEVPSSYETFVRNISVSDFKEISKVRATSGGILPKVNEHGEYKRATMVADGEKYTVEKYGQIIGTTEELLINDDLGAFTQTALFLGQKVKRTENEIFWELIYTPQVMSDGKAIFHADHGNLGTGGVISDASLSEARKLMRLQKDPAGNRINVRPSVLVVPAELENAALKFLSTVTPNSVSGVNNFAGSMQLLVEPILDDANPLSWYIFGALAQGVMAEKATLDGKGPQISVRENWDIDGMETKIKYHFGMRVLDYRQFFKNVGA